jgi:hypothetical protein
MTISISVYTDPGTYISEVIEPGAASTVYERTLGIVAIAPRTRRVTDEAVVRGKVYDETVTIASGSPHIGTLVNASNRDRNNAIMYMNSNALGLGDWSFSPATIDNSATPGTPVNTTATTVPAYLTGGNGATAVVATWNACTGAAAGEFVMTVDGVVRTITGLDFVACLTMADVAAVIQAGIRLATGLLETCVWSVDHFVITSTSTDPFVSEVSEASTVPAGTGTDISGAGGTAFMDSDVGHGIPTGPVSSGTTYLTLSVDGIDPISIALTSSTTTPLTTIATDINTALATSADYGATYNAVASTTATTNPNDTLVLTSPLSTSASDIKIFLSPLNDAASVVSGGSWAPTADAGVQAATIVEVAAAAYSSSGVYTIEYVSIETVEDPLAECTVTDTLDSIVSVGSYPGASSYTKDFDYEDGATTTIDWVTTSYATADITSSVAGPYAIVAATNDVIRLSLCGGDPISITLSAGGAQTATNIAADINAALAVSALYGPDWAHTAVNNAGTIEFKIRTPFQSWPQEHGLSTSIVFYAVSHNAFATLFGAGITLPYEITGETSRPYFGTSYYTTYNYNRPSTDYDTPWKVYNPSQLYAYCSPITMSNYTRNLLAIAGEIAFENNAPSLWVQQINDSSAPGTPTTAQIHAAIDSCEQKSGITDLVVIDSTLDTAVYLMAHVSDQSSMLEKHYRRGWFGMARGTGVGDPDTPDTFVYRATRTLQPGSTSSGRGRLLLVAPSEATRTVTLEDGREVDVDVDGTYIATAVGALFTSLASPADTLINKSITGFRIDDDSFETYLRAERHTLAGNGVTVVTYDAGKLTLLDPITTEAGGGKVVSFEEPSASAQKDAVTATVDSLITNNCVGVVPDDLADFITDVKKWIMLAILSNINSGTIGPYKNSDGSTRDIDPKTDILVYQSSTDPRTYLFKYWYNLRYPAKRFFGEYSVDNPFWGTGA